MKYVLVLGYGWSGSSAVVDLLKEYTSTFQIPIEFRLIKDPHGLMDLRTALIDNWDLLNVDIAIKDFIWFANKLNQDRKKFPCKAGLGYNSALNGRFMQATNEFIKEIASVNYRGNWFYFDYYKSSFRLFRERLLIKTGLIKDANQKMYYSNISADEFDYLAKQYIDSIFPELSDKEQYLVLDQAVPPQNPLLANHFFNEYKIIIVGRDARDNYCDLINQHALIGDELRKQKDIGFYKNWFLRLRINLPKYEKNDNILYISFENLVKEYNKEVKKIEGFIGLSDHDHIEKKSYFNPKESSKNIGIWKKYREQEVIQKIAQSLPDFLNKYAN